MKVFRLSSITIGTLGLLLTALPGYSDSIPGTGGDAFCNITSGPTDCTVNEGQGDRLVELVVNLLSKSITINNIGAGPISAAVPDPTDNITSDPISFLQPGYAAAPACVIGGVLASGATCYFVQSFTTGTPGDAHDQTNIPNDGTSNMSFVLTFTPLAGAVPVGSNLSCTNGQGANVGWCATAGPNAAGAYTATIESAVVHVNDVAPEPAELGLIGMAGVSLALISQVRRSRSS